MSSLLWTFRIQLWTNSEIYPLVFKWGSGFKRKFCLGYSTGKWSACLLTTRTLLVNNWLSEEIKDKVPALPDVKLKTHSNFLGMTVDSNLQWNKPVEFLSKTLKRCLHIFNCSLPTSSLGKNVLIHSELRRLKWIKHFSDEPTTKTAYHALFWSSLGMASWFGVG